MYTHALWLDNSTFITILYLYRKKYLTTQRNIPFNLIQFKISVRLTVSKRIATVPSEHNNTAELYRGQDVVLFSL